MEEVSADGGGQCWRRSVMEEVSDGGGGVRPTLRGRITTGFCFGRSVFKAHDITSCKVWTHSGRGAAECVALNHAVAADKTT
uniref:Uncharacterized protein n=1 Tax=Knipowitschia caucasica TaxID=637954 RepID=A0AAV2LW83_KNICA